MLKDVLALIARLREISESKGAVCARVIPVRVEGKSPIVAHKGGAWTDALCDAFFTDRQKTKYRAGMILYNFILLDFDGVEDDKKNLIEHGDVKYKAWCKQFPELEDAPTERTKKGMHVYLYRSPEVDAAGLSDTALQVPGTGERCCIDLKTRTSSVVNGQLTGGLVVCSPTKNYEWVDGRSLFDMEPPEPSKELIAHILTMVPAKARKLRTGPPKKKAKLDPAEEDGAEAAADPVVQEMDIAGIACRREDATVCLKEIEEMDVADIQRICKRKINVLPVTVRDDGRRFQSFSIEGNCPFCGNITADGKAHNNNFYHYVNVSGVRVIKAFPASNCKEKDIKGPGVRIDYSTKSLEAYQAAFETSVGACARLLSAADTAVVLTRIRPSCKGLAFARGFESAADTARAWWDPTGCGRLYVRLPACGTVHYAVVSSSDGSAALGSKDVECRVTFTKTPWVPDVMIGDYPNVRTPAAVYMEVKPARSNGLRAVVAGML